MTKGWFFSKNIGSLDIPKLYLYNSKISLGQELGASINNALKILSKTKTFGVDAEKSWVIDNFLITDTTSKSRVIFKLNDKVDIQIASLQLILAEAKINHRTIPTEPGIDSNKLEFIDLRFDKPIVRFAPKKP